VLRQHVVEWLRLWPVNSWIIKKETDRNMTVMPKKVTDTVEYFDLQRDYLLIMVDDEVYGPSFVMQVILYASYIHRALKYFGDGTVLRLWGKWPR